MNKIKVKLDETKLMRDSIKFMICDFILAGVALVLLFVSMAFIMIYGDWYLVEGLLGFAASIVLFISCLEKGCEEIKFQKGGCKVED